MVADTDHFADHFTDHFASRLAVAGGTPVVMVAVVPMPAGSWRIGDLLGRQPQCCFVREEQTAYAVRQREHLDGATGGHPERA